MRLSYYQRISDMLPETMTQLKPLQPKANYKYESEDAINLDGTVIANKLLEAMKQRCMPEDVLQILRKIDDKENKIDTNLEYDNEGNNKSQFNSEEITDVQRDSHLKIDVFTSTLLYFGCKSFSHIFAALAKFAVLLI